MDGIIPKEIDQILETLKSSGFSAYAVGGCVRDMIRNIEPNDWDITTSAQPEQIQKIFPNNFYANDFGTVTVITKSERENLKEVEITPYRTDAGYSDARHPDGVKFGVSLEEDLARRDFTINAMAFDGASIVDPFGGQRDLDAKLIRAVGEPEKRFGEDALRLLRAVRFATTIDMKIEDKTASAIVKLASNLKKISQERIRDEFTKIILSRNAEQGVLALEELGLLEFIIPELREGIGVAQNHHHIYTVFDHNVKSLGFSAKSGDNLHIRLAVLLHDVGKPRTKVGESPNATFYGHDIVGASMAKKILSRLKYPNSIIDKASHLVRQHLFNYDVGAVTEAGVRRLLKRVGPENFSDLLKVRMAERLGSGVPKARPYRLRHLEFMAEKVAKDPLSTKMLKVNGNDLMKELCLEPGPKIGALMDVLLAEVIRKPEINEREKLLERAKNLNGMDLDELRKRAKDDISEKQTEEEKQIKRKYRV